MEKLTNAVPHGSILGQLLFLIYINDLRKITYDDAKVMIFTVL